MFNRAIDNASAWINVKCSCCFWILAAYGHFKYLLIGKEQFRDSLKSLELDLE